jgi:uncharacterized SAM-binding protein YcdF (DUF218 family)
VKRLLNWVKTLLLASLATGLVLSLAAAFTVLRDSNVRTLEKADAIVVLGAAQYAGTPSPVLKNRLDTAAKVQKEGFSGVLVTVGSKLPGDETTEAVAGREYLIDKYDLDPIQVIAIAEGDDTFSSLKAVHTLAEENSWDTLIFVSDSLHSARVKTMAESFGYLSYTTSATSGPGSSFDVAYFAKETVGVMYFWVSRLSGTL